MFQYLRKQAYFVEYITHKIRVYQKLEVLYIILPGSDPLT